MQLPDPCHQVISTRTLAGKRTYGWVTFRLNGLSDGIGGLVVGAKGADLFPTSALGSMMGPE
jgi:hypothetical protein